MGSFLNVPKGLTGELGVLDPILYYLSTYTGSRHWYKQPAERVKKVVNGLINLLILLLVHIALKDIKSCGK